MRWLAEQFAGKIIDRDYRTTAAAAGITIDRAKGDNVATFPIERARLRSIWYFIGISTTCTIGYGWTLQSQTVGVAQHSNNYDFKVTDAYHSIWPHRSFYNFFAVLR